MEDSRDRRNEATGAPGAHRIGARTRARERALQALYQVDLASSEPMDALASAWSSDEDAPDAVALSFSEDLVRGVVENRARIDGIVESQSHHWRLERMAKVDRNVLRLAVYELLFHRDVPRKVVLNEAIELAKKFGSEESGGFVNGILDQIAVHLPAHSPPSEGGEA